MNICLTGATGFIGGAVAERLNLEIQTFMPRGTEIALPLGRLST